MAGCEMKKNYGSSKSTGRPTRDFLFLPDPEIQKWRENAGSQIELKQAKPNSQCAKSQIPSVAGARSAERPRRAEPHARLEDLEAIPLTA